MAGCYALFLQGLIFNVIPFLKK